MYTLQVSLNARGVCVLGRNNLRCEYQPFICSGQARNSLSLRTLCSQKRSDVAVNIQQPSL